MEEVAERVTEYLNGLSDSYLKDQLGGTLMQAQNGARRAVFEKATDDGRTYASELLGPGGRVNPRLSAVVGSRALHDVKDEER
jgi:hypothetical protein